MSWVAIGVTVAGAAVSAGTSAYNSSQQKKAAAQANSQAAGAFHPYDPYLLGNPSQVNPVNDFRNALHTNYDLQYEIQPYIGTVNKFNYQQAMHYYNKIQPYFKQLQSQTGQNALAFAQGQLPQDTVQSIGRAAAQRGIEGGFGFGTQGASNGALANLNLRNLGLTSLDLTKYGTGLGMQVNQTAKALLPNLMSEQDFMLTPQQYIASDQYNTTAQNQFALQNAEYINQARAINATGQNSLGQNAVDRNYATALAGIGAQNQAVQQGAGLLSQYFANRNNQYNSSPQYGGGATNGASGWTGTGGSGELAAPQYL